MSEIQNFIAGPSNKALLKRFALDKLGPEWPRKRSALEAAVDANLEEVLESTVGPYGPYKAWALTPQNVKDINVAIWKALRPAVERAMKGSHVDPEEALDNMMSFRGPMMPFEESKSEGLVPERDLEALHERYVQSWRS